MGERMETAVVSVGGAGRELVSPYDGFCVPAIVADLGEEAIEHFVNFFTAEIKNPNTRASYGMAVAKFLQGCEQQGLGLTAIKPVTIAGYIEALEQEPHNLSIPSVKLHLSGIKRFFDYMVVKQVVPVSPAVSVRGPKYSQTKGKTPYLSAEEARELLDSIDTSSVVGLRDKAIIAMMLFQFRRVSAVINMQVRDYFQQGKRWHFRFFEKGGDDLSMPAHSTTEEYLDAYLDVAKIRDEKKGPLFRKVDKQGVLTLEPLNRRAVLKMIKRRARAAGLPENIGNHSFRASAITIYRKNNGPLEGARKLAGHKQVKTTQLYDHSDETVTLAEVQRVAV